MGKIDVKALCLESFFNATDLMGDGACFYQIPDYQRPYCWDKNNVSDLIDDLFYAYVNSKNNEYFCGSVVLVKNFSDERFDVIDGQQRITTFTILFCVLRDVFKGRLDKQANDLISESISDRYDIDKRRLKFLTNDDNQAEFEQKILKEIIFLNKFRNEQSIPNNIYLQNAHFIKIELEEVIKNEFNNGSSFDVNDFIKWLFDKVVFTVIKTNDLENAIQVFNVLNDRGLALRSTDILKSKLMLNLSKEDRKTFKTTWNSIEKSVDIEDMLNSYLYYLICDNPKTSLDKEILNKYKNEFGAEKNIDSLKKIVEIKDFSDAYIKACEVEESHNKDIYLLSYLRHKIYWKSILSTAYFVNYQYTNELINTLVAFYFMHWIAGSTIARLKTTSFKIISSIKNKEDISVIKKICKENLDKYDIDKIYKEELRTSDFYNRVWSKPVLIMYEYSIKDDSVPTYIPLDQKITQEHILPQCPDEKSDWFQIFTDEERVNLTNSIGNMTLLSLKKNVQASNDSFSKKKEIYLNKDNVASSFVMTINVLSKDVWNKDEISNRANEILTCIENKLNLFD